MSTQQHTYEYEVDITSQTAPAKVIRMVGSEKSVLEIGCGPGSITKHLSANGNRITGMEIDAEAIKRVAPYCDSIISADLNSEDWPELLHSEKFDVVIAADVLEHLYDPWNTLKRMKTLVSPSGCLILSIPHVGHAAIGACLISGNFDYRDWGLLDRTHIRFFGLKNIEDLFAQAGLKIIEAQYVILPPQETEFAKIWDSLPFGTKRALNNSPHAHIYQVVVRAVELDQPGDALTLIPPEISRTVMSRSIRSRIAANLSPEIKQRIRSMLRVLGIRI